MTWFDALLLGIVEGLTEFLPVASTAHLTIAEKLLGLTINDPGVTAFSAVIQVGAIAAVTVYFRRDIAALAAAWFRGLASRAAGRQYRMAWYVVAGSVPIGIIGFATKGLTAGPLRNLWVVVGALVVWSVVMVLAERLGSQGRAETDLRLRDTMVVGVVQCLALVPGVSRSAATISAGLFRGLDRTAATRLSSSLSITALVAAGSYEGVTAASDISDSVGWGATAVVTGVSSRWPTRRLPGCSVSSPLTASPSSSVTACCGRPHSPSAWELASSMRPDPTFPRPSVRGCSTSEVNVGHG